jgi:hypothetical protein
MAEQNVGKSVIALDSPEDFERRLPGLESWPGGSAKPAPR